MNKWLKIGGVAGAVVVVVVAILGIAAFALLPNPVSARMRATGFEREVGAPFPVQPQQAPFDRMEQFGHPGGPGGFGSTIDREALLADALGITVEELRAAFEEANTAAVQQALDEGLIARVQADRMLARIKLNNYIDREALLAQALGITVEELQNARTEGKTIWLLINELELDPATVRTDLNSAYQDAIQQAVDDGVITQDQADRALNRPGFGFGGPGGFGRGGFGGPGGFHGPGGFGGPRGFGRR